MQKVRDVMTPNPVVVAAQTSLVEAARQMRDLGVGSVIVTQDNTTAGILTDRDIVVRGLANGGDVEAMTVGEVCSHDSLASVAADEDAASAAEVMRSHAVRRLPVVDGGRLVGVVSLGDLAAERDPNSVLGAISSAPPNN